MRILIFSTAYFPLVGGAEIAFKEITDRIGNYNFDLVTARFSNPPADPPTGEAGKNPKKEKIGNITVYRVGRGTKFDKYLLPILGFFKAKKLLRKNKYSLIWSINASQAGLAASFFKLKNSKIPFLLTIQEGSSKQRIFRRRWMVWPLFKMIFKKADHVQAISKHLANYGKKMGARCSIKVVPNGVDVRKFQISNFKFQIDELKEKIGIKEGEKVIITVSRLVPKNAVGDLIKAVNILNRRNTQIDLASQGTQKYADNQRKSAYSEGQDQRVSANLKFKLLILGTGYLRKKLELQVASFGLQDKVLFLGLIPPDEVPKYLAISNVFVRPSISEGFGNVFVEAMAASVPIIGTLVGGIPDFLEDEETGLFCQPNNPKSIVQAIEKILENKDLREKLIENGKKLVEEKYDWDIIAKKMDNIFKRLCAS